MTVLALLQLLAELDEPHFFEGPTKPRCDSKDSCVKCVNRWWDH